MNLAEAIADMHCVVSDSVDSRVLVSSRTYMDVDDDVDSCTQGALCGLVADLLEWEIVATL